MTGDNPDTDSYRPRPSDGLVFYDRQGNPITEDQWYRSRSADPEGHIVARTFYVIDGDQVEVSTVHLGTDYGFGRSHVPIIFETMIFGGPLDGRLVRYATEDEAIAGHEFVCEQVQHATAAEPSNGEGTDDPTDD